ncbi:hypothetical protein, partial [Altericroceibacterium endophyticum]|uniref:hypothetical protein n=1 Tax=Altericroceibacterium endophyticum TaxID=1808508 RepID=UPI001F3FFC2C
IIAKGDFAFLERVKTGPIAVGPGLTRLRRKAAIPLTTPLRTLKVFDKLVAWQSQFIVCAGSLTESGSESGGHVCLH